MRDHAGGYLKQRRARQGQINAVRELDRVTHWRARKAAAPAPTLGDSVVRFYKDIERRLKALGPLAEVVYTLIPQPFHTHIGLESFTRGNLVLLVDSAPHHYELKQLLLAGLQSQLLLAGRRHGLRKLTLRQGAWYVGPPGEQRPHFD